MRAIFWLFLFLCTSMHAQIKLRDAYQKSQSFSSGEYSLVNMFKAVHLDTTITKFTNKFDRANRIFLTQNVKIANTQYFKEIWHYRSNNKDTIIFIPENREKRIYDSKHKYYNSTLNNFNRQYLFVPFFRDKYFKRNYIDNVNMQKIPSQNNLYHGYTCSIYEAKEKNITRKIYINEMDSLIVGYSEAMFSDGDIQYDESFLENYQIRPLTLKTPNLTELGITSESSQKSEERSTNQEEGSYQKQLEDWLFENNIIPDSLLDKILYVYLWHLGCYPCLKGLPSIQQLENEVNDKRFKVICINPINKEYLIKSFFQKKSINLLSISMNDIEGVPHPIGGFYPRVLILEPNYKTHYYSPGYHPSFMNQHKKMIMKILSK